MNLGPLIRSENPGSVLLDRPAQRAAEFVVDQRWGRPGWREEISCGDVAVSQKVERGPVNLVRAAFGYHHYNAARRCAVLGRIIAGLDLELLDRLKRGPHRVALMIIDTA